MAIWSKGNDTTDALVHAFTVADDWRYDRHLVPYDILGSIAHARMLAATGIIPAADGAALVAGLRALYREHAEGLWTVEPTDEDVHSRVELLLTERLGEPGKRLHTGRSRNDQVLTDLRLWQKHRCLSLGEQVAATAAALLAQAAAHEFHPLPGYTHLQRAMPSSVGLFFAAHAQGLLESLIGVDAAATLVDRCPLGSGASYGVGLPLDRAMAARDLGFARHSGVCMADANSRGKVDGSVLDACGLVLGDLSRLAADMVFFTSQECGFFTLGKGFTTGSSIMPQKRNPDLFELIRARHAAFIGMRAGLAGITAGLASGYSRDLQDTKPLVIDGLTLCERALGVVAAAAPTIQPVRERIVAALTPDLYATDEAYRLVREQGMTFRDAYVLVGSNLDKVGTLDHDACVRGRTHAGSTGNLGLPALRSEAEAAGARFRDRRLALEACWNRLLKG
jgi:argininosuccinate lyase